MILHFSHIGLTDGRTFMFPFGWIQAPRLWRPVRSPYLYADKSWRTQALARFERDRAG